MRTSRQRWRWSSLCGFWPPISCFKCPPFSGGQSLVIITLLSQTLGNLKHHHQITISKISHDCDQGYFLHFLCLASTENVIWCWRWPKSARFSGQILNNDYQSDIFQTLPFQQHLDNQWFWHPYYWLLIKFVQPCIHHFYPYLCFLSIYWLWTFSDVHPHGSVHLHNLVGDHPSCCLLQVQPQDKKSPWTLSNLMFKYFNICECQKKCKKHECMQWKRSF